MLYDPKWEKKAETKPDVFALASFVEWLEQQPAEAEYDWPSVDNCAVCNYLRATTGVREPAVTRWVNGRHGFGGDTFGIGWGYHEICRPLPWTYSAAAQRARALIAARRR